ncbi:tetratricopeptide repeat protein [Sphaerotilus mobilis]|uniref:Tetratricopeptide repeat protein n=1 Tax=Sphaerotilus mobilis TaxID=47994 RepID=A0A4V2EUZ5_9BURK|nr:tetratricopeptide repeat protein [Sphaerotilus mobilis]
MTLAALASASGHAPGSDANGTVLDDLLSDWRKQHPDEADDRHLRLFDAASLRLRGELDEAHRRCDLLMSDPDVAPAAVQLELALIALARHDLSTAMDALNVAVTLDPDLGVGWLKLGEVQIRLDQFQDAETTLQEAARCLVGEPQADAWYLLGEAHRMRRRYAEASAAYEASLAIQPTRRQALIARGHVHLMAEEEGQALACYEEALRLSPQVPPDVKLNMGSIRQNLGDFDGARAMFERLLTERPGDHAARWYLSQLDLLQGRWVAGWANYSVRFRAGAVPYRPMPYANWDGRPLANETLLVLADQGLGDEIMFASCLPDLQARAPKTIVECEPRLLALFKRSFPGLHLIATEREKSTDWLIGCPTPTWQISAGDLPRFFRQSDADFPRHEGYLKADPARVEHWRQRLRASSQGRSVIGISWRGGLVGTRTQARSISVNEWRPILSCPGLHFVNLQYGDCGAELAELQATHGITIDHHPDVIADYDETAALVCALDLVVSVCTSIIHLTGALGRPVWVLTPHSPGWRYTADRTQLPWYPSSRIFRQPRAGDWGSACHELSVELHALTRSVSPDLDKGPEVGAQS